MPGQLFNDAGRRRLGGYPPQVPQEDLVTFYTLTRADRAEVNRCTDAASRLGFALQLGALRHLGFCPDDPTSAPPKSSASRPISSRSIPGRYPPTASGHRLAPITSSPSRPTWASASRTPRSGSDWPGGCSTGPWSTTAPCCSGSWPRRVAPGWPPHRPHRGEKFKFRYTYDFGDNWEHAIVVEMILTPEEGKTYPVCVARKRAGPPENVGGVWGCFGFIEAMQDPKHPRHAEFAEWFEYQFATEAFDIDEVNRQLSRRD